MITFITKSMTFAFAVITVLFTFVPESSFGRYEWLSKDLVEKCRLSSFMNTEDINIIISRLICFFLVWIITSGLYALFLRFRRKINIHGQNYSICIEYGDIFKTKNCKRVINFDECFTTQVGSRTADIIPTSICGKYLLSHPNLDIQQLIDDAAVKPARSKSKYQRKTRYESGTIVPNGNDLLMAFAKLDERGKGRFFSRDEYLECLNLLWKELENYYSGKDVCIPILGAGTTSFDGGEGASIPKQDLLDMMIWSYRLSSHKIKAPYKLRIICNRSGDFSINNVL